MKCFLSTLLTIFVLGCAPKYKLIEYSPAVHDQFRSELASISIYGSPRYPSLLVTITNDKSIEVIALRGNQFEKRTISKDEHDADRLLEALKAAYADIQKYSPPEDIADGMNLRIELQQGEVYGSTVLTNYVKHIRPIASVESLMEMLSRTVPARYWK